MTLRELLAMAEGRIRENWNHTSAMLALLSNVHRDPKKGRALRPADFHPLLARAKDKAPPLKADIGLLKTVFVDNACCG